MKKLEEYKSGKYVRFNNYNSFIPSNINENWSWNDTKLTKLLSEADRKLR